VRWRQATSGGVRAGMFADHVRSGVGVKRSGQPGMSTGGAPWGPVSTTPSKHARQVDETDGVAIRRLEDYGFGKGCQHVYETFLPLLSDLDQHVRAGRNVALILHDCTATVPNPKGEDYIRWEPRLQSPASGKASIRLRGFKVAPLDQRPAWLGAKNSGKILQVIASWCRPQDEVQTTVPGPDRGRAMSSNLRVRKKCVLTPENSSSNGKLIGPK